MLITFFFFAPEWVVADNAQGQHFVGDFQQRLELFQRKELWREWLWGSPARPGRVWLCCSASVTHRHSVAGIMENNKLYFYKTFHTDCTHARAHAALTRTEASPPMRLRITYC